MGPCWLAGLRWAGWAAGETEGCTGGEADGQQDGLIMVELLPGGRRKVNHGLEEGLDLVRAGEEGGEVVSILAGRGERGQWVPREQT